MIFLINFAENRVMEVENGIKKFRQRLQISTQEALAKELGVNQATISNWEKGEFLQTYEPIRKLFEMGATVEELFGVSYGGVNVAPTCLKVSKEEATAIVKVGLYNLIGSVGVMQNENILGG